MIRVRTGALAALMSLGLAGTAWAHAHLLSADPGGAVWRHRRPRCRSPSSMRRLTVLSSNACPHLNGGKQVNNRNPLVCIVGTGPAGLVLAHILRRARISCVVLERQQTGELRALTKAGLI
jgi:hypothetical protein